MEYGADKYCKEKAAAFQDRINHLSVEPLGRQLDCILGNGSFKMHGNGYGERVWYNRKQRGLVPVSDQ